MHDSGKRTFIDHLSSIADPRRVHKKLHELVDILFLSTCAVLAGADGPTEIEAFGVDRIEWLRKFVPLAKGVPSHDTIGRVLSLIKVEAFQSAFLHWVMEFFPESPPVNTAKEMRIAIDGKVLRGSARQNKGLPALQIISAWSLDYQATLGIKSVEKKSNEIAAIPLLLRELELRGAIITIDAMGCQREIAETIIDEGAEYVLAVKGNQPRLFEAITEEFDRRADVELLEGDRSYHAVNEINRGRQEHRSYQLIALPKSMAEFKQEW